MSEICEASGSLSVLNCGMGDLEISFDHADEAEVEKAKRIITDMLKRGYTILVEYNGKLRRARTFDAKRERYVIADPPKDAPKAVKREARKGVPLRRARATGIAPTAGG